MTEETLKGDCPKCGKDRRAAVVGHHKKEEEFDLGYGKEWACSEYRIMKCLGCEEVYFQTRSLCSLEWDHDSDGNMELTPRISYWPRHSRRERPRWRYDVLPEGLNLLLAEVYSAVEADALRLAAMGIRAAIELVMVERVGDMGTFAKNMDAFQARGYLSIRQRGTIDTILEAGHATTHRSWRPSQDDVNTLLDVTEGLIADIYVHEKRASDLEGTLPRRQPRTPSAN
jgi:hypothetical protein